jgi:hypothetical protein
MSCNDYTIELIATQLVILENNTANHSPQGKKYSAIRTTQGPPKMSKTTKYFCSTAQSTISINYNKNTIMILIIF